MSPFMRQKCDDWLIANQTSGIEGDAVDVDRAGDDSAVIQSSGITNEVAGASRCDDDETDQRLLLGETAGTQL